jgi:hypothetical protein
MSQPTLHLHRLCGFKKYFFFCSTLLEFENFLLCERILINVTQLAKTKRQANFKGFKRFGAFKGLVEQKNVVFNSSNKLL